MYNVKEPTKIIGLFCKRDLQKRLYSVKEMYNVKEPTKIICLFCKKDL